MKFGLSTGPSLVGNMGSAQRFNFTVAGRHVNEATKLHAATRVLGVDILITDRMARAVRSQFLCRRIRKCMFQGFNKPLNVFEPLCEVSTATQRAVDLINQFESSLSKFEEMRFEEAESELDSLLCNYPEDTASIVLREELFSIRQHPELIDATTWSSVKLIPPLK